MCEIKSKLRKFGSVKRRVSGFTLIELIIVMAVIGGMGTIFLTTFPASQQRARDTNRKSDLKQFQVALEIFANKNTGNYPIVGAITRPMLLCGAGNPLSSADRCPDDPRYGTNNCNSGACLYNYESNASGATQYALWARLERPQDSTKEFFVICSNGQSGEGTVPTAGGDCPL